MQLRGLDCSGLAEDEQEDGLTSEPLRLTTVYEDGGGGWIVASAPEVPGM